MIAMAWTVPGEDEGVVIDSARYMPTEAGWTFVKFFVVVFIVCFVLYFVDGVKHDRPVEKEQFDYPSMDSNIPTK